MRNTFNLVKFHCNSTESCKETEAIRNLAFKTAINGMKDALRLNEYRTDSETYVNVRISIYTGLLYENSSFKMQDVRHLIDQRKLANNTNALMTKLNLTLSKDSRIKYVPPNFKSGYALYDCMKLDEIPSSDISGCFMFSSNKEGECIEKSAKKHKVMVNVTDCYSRSTPQAKQDFESCAMNVSIKLMISHRDRLFFHRL